MRLRRAFELSLALAFSLVLATTWTGAVSGALSLTAPQQGLPSSAFVNPKDYGAIADGRSHPLSATYSSLDAARAVYPFITSLAQEIDYAAVKAASNAAFGTDGGGSTSAYRTPDTASTVSLIIGSGVAYTPNALIGNILLMRYPNAFIASSVVASNTATTITLASPLPYDLHPCGGRVCTAACGQADQTFPCSQYALTSGEHGYVAAFLNKPLYLPAGTYEFGNDTWLIRNASGIHIYGAGQTATTLRSNTTVFRTDGLWYSTIEGISFIKLGVDGLPAFDIDGNVPGHPYATRSVQQNTFSNLSIDGGGDTNAFYLNRQGQSSAQGENLYIELHLQNADTLYHQYGFNALSNVFIRGNFQNYLTGVKIEAGQIAMYGTAMQTTRGYAQIQNGWDVDASTSGVSERIILSGLNNESFRFFHGSAAQTGVLIGNQTRCSCLAWSAHGNYSLNGLINKGNLWRVSTAGTTGAVEPTWDVAASPITDGTVVWTYTPFKVVDAGTAGNVSMSANSFHAGQYQFNTYEDQPLELYSADLVLRGDGYRNPHRYIFMDTSGGNRTVELTNGIRPPDGQIVTVKKVTTDANTVTLTSGFGNGMEAAVIPGGSTGYVTVQFSLSAGVSVKWWIISKSF